MDEPPEKNDEPSEELREAWTLHYVEQLAAMRAREGRLPPLRSSTTPAPRSITPTPEPRAAQAQGKDPSWPAPQTATPAPSTGEVSAEPADAGPPELSPERIAELERKAVASVDTALSKPARIRGV